MATSTFTTYEKTCFILGSTGETGKQLLSIFCENEKFDKIIALNRKPLDFNHSKFEERIVDFSDLKLYADKFHGGNVAICCIGTTLSKVKKVKKYLNFRAKKIITIEFLISQIFIILFIKIRQNLNMLNEI